MMYSMKLNTLFIPVCNAFFEPFALQYTVQSHDNNKNYYYYYCSDINKMIILTVSIQLTVRSR